MTATQSFFRSRWVEAPPHLSVLRGGLPKGFRASGVACGIKMGDGFPTGGVGVGGAPAVQPDLGLLVCDAATPTSAARFTRSGTLSAPVLLCLERCRLDAVRAVIANSGNANAATGELGLRDAARMRSMAAAECGIAAEEEVAVASTGVIGVPLPVEAIVAAVPAACRELRADGDADFAEAIRTTDAFPKRASLEVELPSGMVRLAAQAKGAGMISPGFATLLCFIQTDAELSAQACELLLGVTAERSFERISVDGQLSPSDTVILQCSGESGVGLDPESEEELRFGEALDVLLRQLALEVVRDGEGARRVGRVVVRGGDPQAVHGVARAVAGSSLVKAALYGGDPNWGRIVQAAGMATPGMAPLEVGVAIEGIQVCSRGAVVPHDRQALEKAVARDEVEYEVALPGDGAETELFFSDLGHEYVTINAEYTT